MAFIDCKCLVNVEIPDGVTEIGDYAFERFYELESVNIPFSVSKIGWECFDFCESLVSINVDNRNEFYASIDGVLFNKEIIDLLKFPSSKIVSVYTIPDTVTYIRRYAFINLR